MNFLMLYIYNLNVYFCDLSHNVEIEGTVGL
jgi:hypothetical protein